MDRRSFLQSTVAGALAAGVKAQQPAPGRTIGIQIGAVSFADEGVEKVLDTLQQSASINTIFLATFTYGRGIAGRQVPGQPLPDHGKQEYDTGSFYGGSYTAVHPQYYKDTVFRDFRAPDLGKYDVLEEVLPATRKRGIKTICWFEDVFRKDLPNIGQLEERELSGNAATTLCFNNPNYRHWLLGIAEDWSRSHPIDGIMWGSERQGAFSNALSASHGRSDPDRVTCFCQFCQAKAKERGINVERARAGFIELAKFVRAGRAHQRPVDGYYVTLWRLMLRYPELLAWEMLWTDSLRETYAAIHQKVKPVARSRLAHLAQQFIQSDLSGGTGFGGDRETFRLPQGRHLSQLRRGADGELYRPRARFYLWRCSRTGAARLSLPGSELRREEPGGNSETGFSADYVLRETKRARAGLADTSTKLWPGIDIDIPTAANHSKSTPEGTRQAVLAAIHGGADGVLLSRKYSEMKLANLRGAGAALREAGWG